jgi:hypothetical protein
MNETFVSNEFEVRLEGDALEEALIDVVELADDFSLNGPSSFNDAGDLHVTSDDLLLRNHNKGLTVLAGGLLGVGVVDFFDSNVNARGSLHRRRWQGILTTWSQGIHCRISSKVFGGCLWSR